MCKTNVIFIETQSLNSIITVTPYEKPNSIIFINIQVR